MAMDSGSRQRLHDFLYDSFDDDNAADMETFGQNYLHNGTLLDAIGDRFPTASMSVVKAVMMEAYGAWRRDTGKD